MKRHFEDDLQAFNAHLLKLANLTEQSINDAIAALKSRDIDKARKAIASDTLIDALELVIEEEGIDLLALHQPMAGDLRMITTGMKINTELERIADLAVNISQRVMEVVEEPMLKPLVDIPCLADLSRQMVRDSIESFVNRNELLAKQVILADTQADDLKNRIQNELIYDFIVKDGTTAPRAVPLILVARHLERICDHATYIAEDVIYMVNARVVKHRRNELLQDTDIANE